MFRSVMVCSPSELWSVCSCSIPAFISATCKVLNTLSFVGTSVETLAGDGRDISEFILRREWERRKNDNEEQIYQLTPL